MESMIARGGSGRLTPETAPPPKAPPHLAAVLVRAVIYALALAILVVFAPAGEHVFIYQGF